MNKRKGILEELIRKCGGLIELDNLLAKILDYYDMDDFIKHTNHYRIFHALYVERKKNYLQIAIDNHIGENTLSRYVTLYNYIAKRFIEKYNYKILDGYLKG
jgi:hypothetical protein